MKNISMNMFTQPPPVGLTARERSSRIDQALRAIERTLLGAQSTRHGKPIYKKGFLRQVERVFNKGTEADRLKYA